MSSNLAVICHTLLRLTTSLPCYCHWTVNGDFSGRPHPLMCHTTGDDSTCTRAFEVCESNTLCRSQLSLLKTDCSHSYNCSRSTCALAIRRFVRRVPDTIREPIMFCRCVKGDRQCLDLQQLMYPSCLYRIQGAPISCTTAVHRCKQQRSCRLYATLFFDYCPTADNGNRCGTVHLDYCRNALSAIRGTSLERPCFCPISDKICRKYQSGMLPNNPCIEEAMLRYESSQQHLETTRKFHPTMEIIPKDRIHSHDEITTEKPLEIDQSHIWNAGNRTDDFHAINNDNEGHSKTSHVDYVQGLPNMSIEYDDSEGYMRGSESEADGNQEKIVQKKHPQLTLKTRPITAKKMNAKSSGGCLAKDTSGKLLLHEKESVIRRYRDYSGRCSSWCICGKNEKLQCHKLPCLPDGNCSAPLTVIGFGEKLYIRDRGVCTCQSGEFICDTAETSPPLGTGLYMMVGYSRREVEWLWQQMPENVLEKGGFLSKNVDIANDIGAGLQFALQTFLVKDTQCRMALIFEWSSEETSDNLIFQLEWYGILRGFNESVKKWRTGGPEKFQSCFSSASRLVHSFVTVKAVRYQLVLSTVKQIRLIDSLPAFLASNQTLLSYSNTIVFYPIFCYLMFAQFV